MNLITNPPITATRTQEKALAIMTMPSRSFIDQLTLWQSGMDLLWDDEDIEGVLEAMGTRAVEVFSVSAIVVNYLESLLPGCTADRIAKMLPFTINVDGTITLN